MREWLTDMTLLACFSAGLCITFMTFVVIEFLSFASARYRERYTQETSVEYGDVLLSMPPRRIFDLSLALSALAAFAVTGLIFVAAAEPSWTKIIFFAGLAAVAAFPGPRLYLRYLKRQRLAKFNEQLEDALLSISGSLKAGFNIVQALDLIANENRRPISYEFTILTQELRLGVQFETAMDKMVKRVGSADFELVAVAITTARQTGGALTGVLERLAAVIRERVRIAQKLKALTAQGRLQAYLIGAMPFLLLIALAKIAPDMMDVFFGSILGILTIVAVIVLDVAGFLVIRKITNIDI